MDQNKYFAAYYLNLFYIELKNTKIFGYNSNKKTIIFDDYDNPNNFLNFFHELFHHFQSFTPYFLKKRHLIPFFYLCKRIIDKRNNTKTHKLFNKIFKKNNTYKKKYKLKIYFANRKITKNIELIQLFEGGAYSFENSINKHFFIKNKMQELDYNIYKILPDFIKNKLNLDDDSIISFILWFSLFSFNPFHLLNKILSLLLKEKKKYFDIYYVKDILENNFEIKTIISNTLKETIKELDSICCFLNKYKLNHITQYIENIINYLYSNKNKFNFIDKSINFFIMDNKINFQNYLNLVIKKYPIPLPLIQDNYNYEIKYYKNDFFKNSIKEIFRHKNEKELVKGLEEFFYNSKIIIKSYIFDENEKCPYLNCSDNNEICYFSIICNFFNIEKKSFCRKYHSEYYNTKY